MGRFGKNIFWGLVVAIVLILILERMVCFMNNDYSYKRRYMDNHASEIKTLLLGHSLAENGINPHLLGDSVFCAAQGARWIYYDVEILKRYLPKLTNLKTVIYPVKYSQAFYYSFHYVDEFPKRYKNPSLYARQQMSFYSKFWDIDFDRMPMKLLSRSFLLCNSIHYKNFWSEPMSDSIGYMPFPFEKEIGWRLQENTSTEIERNSSGQLNEFLSYLKIMSELCDDYSVKLIIVIPPFHDSYIENTTNDGRAKLDSLLQSIKGAEYKNYMVHYEFRDDSLYYNSSHLNHVGASKFSIKLKKDFGL